MANDNPTYRAIEKYKKKTYDRIELLVYKGEKQQIKDFAAKRGKTVNGFILFFNLPIDVVYRKICRFCEAAWRRSRRKSRTILIPSKPSALTYRFLSGNQYIDIVYILIRN